MATPRRVQFPGATYHVTVKALDELWPFETPALKERCLAYVATALQRRRIECHAYCVMSNHLHLLLRTPEGGLPEAMQQANAAVARLHNRTAGRRGRVLLAPYHPVLIEEQSHLLEAARYVVLNPVRAGICADPADYPWSSYRATAGLARPPRFLTSEWLLAQLGGRDGYRRFVADGCPAETLEGLLLLAA